MKIIIELGIGLLMGILLGAIYVFFNTEEKSKVKQKVKQKIQKWVEEEPTELTDLSQNRKSEREQPLPKPKLYAIFK